MRLKSIWKIKEGKKRKGEVGFGRTAQKGKHSLLSKITRCFVLFSAKTVYLDVLFTKRFVRIHCKNLFSEVPVLRSVKSDFSIANLNFPVN
jgi:hypothetical protein